MKKMWKRIAKGEMLPTSSIIRPIDGGLSNIAGSRVMVGQDCYYLSVDDAYELLKGLPLETEAEEKERNEATIIKKLIGLVKETEFLSEENRTSLLDWLQRKGEQKPVWSEEEKKKLDRIYYILGIAADEHAYSNTCKLIGDKEAVELQDFLRSIAKPEQKPAWNEKDEEMFNYTINLLNYNFGCRTFLKSLKFRLLSPSIREFDKEEGSIIDHLIAICDDAMCYDTFAGCSKKDIEKYKSFLTNLKFGINPQPQTTWKPSDEQMKVLDVAIKSSHLTTDEYNGLVKLREQLKSL